MSIESRMKVLEEARLMTTRAELRLHAIGGFEEVALVRPLIFSSKKSEMVLIVKDQAQAAEESSRIFDRVNGDM